MDLDKILTPELKAAITESLAGERKVWEKRIEDLATSTQTGAAETKTAYEALLKRIDSIQALMGKADADAMQSEVVSMGKRFFDSEQLKEFKSRAKHKGGISYTYKGGMWEGWGLKKKDITEGTITAPSVGLSTRLPDWVFAGVRTLRVRDLLRSVPVNQGAVNYVKENSFTNAAYPQTEGSSKGHAALTFTVGQAVVQAIAHYIKASRQALDDIAQLQASIDFKLLVGLKDEEDFELLRGDGTGSHQTGLMVAGGTYDTTKHVAGDTALDTISEGLETIESANHTATGIVLNPTNWRQMTRLKDSQNRYLLGGPGMITEPRLWGLPVALSNAMPIDQFLVGDFVRGAEIYDRMEAVIDISTENEDDFIKNMVTIRAEERIALAVFRSDYFTRGFLDGAAHI